MNFDVEYEKDNRFAPYCQKCKSLMRMMHTDVGWKCLTCNNIIISKIKIEKLKEENRKIAKDLNNRK
jgi:hypothetical protein